MLTSVSTVVWLTDTLLAHCGRSGRDITGDGKTEQNDQLIRETEKSRDSLVVRERTGTGLAGVWTAGGRVSEVSRGALLTVKSRGVVLAVRTGG